jgi:hypothetical protein
MSAAARFVRTALGFLTVATIASEALVAQTPAEPAVATAPEANALRLPAPLYDVVGAWDLGWGDAPGRGRPGVSGSASIARANGGAANVGWRGAGAPVQTNTVPSQFMIREDSILYRRGSDRAAIAVAHILRIEEVRWPAANQRAWVKVVYEVVEGEESMFFRQANASSQATLLATIESAVKLNRARQEMVRE